MLEIRRQRQPHLYNLRVEKPAPPVPRHLRYEIGERHYLFGRDDVEPDPREIETLAAALAASGVEAVAVCLLHSYDDPTHERSVGVQLREALPGVFVCLSSDVAPEPGEYERTSTTAINACLGPVMSGYLTRITTGARGNGLVVEPTILQSNGGVASAGDAAMLPARALASGPAAGVTGALGVADAVGLDDVITFDVGGTTADVCLVERGTPLVASEREVAGYPVRFPMIDVHSVGAGGGSIAWIDSGGFMHVGPRSAGASPGPAAYGRGGESPTVTDACLVLGHLSRDGLLAGRLPLDIDAAWVTASSATHRIDASRSAADAASGHGATVRSVRFVGAPDAVECPVVPRATLRPGAIAHGPLIVEQMDATTVAAPGERLEIDGSGVMVLRVAPD